MSFPVFLDTCALYPQTVCDLLLRIAEAGAYRPHWSQDVLDELERNLAVVVPAGSDGAGRRVRAMAEAFPPEALAPHHTAAAHPDNFLLDQLDLYPRLVLGTLRQQCSDTQRPRLTPLKLLASLERSGVGRFAAEVRRKADISSWKEGSDHE